MKPLFFSVGSGMMALGLVAAAQFTPVLVLGLFAGFTALCVGLLRLFLRRGFPTAASAARTLDLPVLAAARLK